MKFENSIRAKVKEAFAPDYFELENESHRHNVPAGSETHFRLLIVSDYFKSMSRVDRARKVHQQLAEELKSGVHALSERIFTSEEWDKLPDQQKLMISPKCLGGSKRS